MILKTVKLLGFRNYKDAEINLNDKSLIIGANDVGKTNFLWALRLLLDRSLSDFQIEPKDTDFYALDETNEFSIYLHFEDVTEDCVLSRVKEYVGDDGKMVLCYQGFRDPKSRVKSYKLFAGKDVDNLEEQEDRKYRKVLNLKYISSRRDLHNYISREKSFLFENAKEQRDDDQQKSDEMLYVSIQQQLKIIDEQIPKLNFIATATTTINEELAKLSLHHTKQEIVFDSATSNVDDFINNVSISSKQSGKNILVGGDGKLNQIYLALWASRNELTSESLKEVTIFCIEEPEAHLHPHQQRKLADYLSCSLKGQVLITSHSPQIATEFSPNSIVRLHTNGLLTVAASNGCSPIIQAAYKGFGYRLSIIPSEAFFADAVLLVEGPSEEIFYKTLAKQLGIDLDRLNISILQVDGIGFGTYIKILTALGIQWVMRTDNDIMKIPRADGYRMAGVQRCLKAYGNSSKRSKKTESVIRPLLTDLTGFKTRIPEQKNINAADAIMKELKQFDIFISEIDLENDLFNSVLKEDLQDFFSDEKPEDIVALMQKRKATFMYNFLSEKKEGLSQLKGDGLAYPLLACQNLILKLRQ